MKKKKSALRKEASLRFRVSTQTRVRLEGIAQAREQSLSDYVRQAVLDALEAEERRQAALSRELNNS